MHITWGRGWHINEAIIKLRIAINGRGVYTQVGAYIPGFTVFVLQKIEICGAPFKVLYLVNETFHKL